MENKYKGEIEYSIIVGGLNVHRFLISFSFCLVFLFFQLELSIRVNMEFSSLISTGRHESTIELR